MTKVFDDETSDQPPDRRKNKLRFDRSISLGTVISLLVLLFSILGATRNVISKMDHIERSSVKADVMWEHFVNEHKDISQSDWERLR